MEKFLFLLVVKKFYVNDWLVNGENIFMNDGGVADFKFYDGPAHYSDHVISFKSKDTNIVLNKFIFYSLMNQKNKIYELFIGSGLKNISKKKFHEFIIFFPSIKEQQKIVEILDKFHELEKELELRKKTICVLKK